jgi:hypothetical protein
MRLIPVTLPPGRARLATRSLPNGSPASAMTIGMVEVARLAASGASVPNATMTLTLRRTSSAASSGSRSSRFSAQRRSNARFFPSIHPNSDKATFSGKWLGTCVEIADFVCLPGLLRTGHRPSCRRAAEQRDEVAPFHCPMPPALQTERIAHLSYGCAARFHAGLSRLRVKLRSHGSEMGTAGLPSTTDIFDECRHGS